MGKTRRRDRRLFSVSKVHPQTWTGRTLQP